MPMDTPENYYAILGVPLDADSDTLKRAYRQLARRYHPDLAGPGGAVEMKRINRAYAVLSDPEKRRSYDAVVGGVIDLRRGGFVRPSPRPHDLREDMEFSGLSIFSTKGPLHTGPAIHSELGVISALSSVRTVEGLRIAAGSLDGKGMLWPLVQGRVGSPVSFAADPAATVESLRELRFSSAGSLLAGWGRLHLHIWDAYSGALLWSYNLMQRAISAHYSLDVALQTPHNAKPYARLALPYLPDDIQAPRAWGVRATDVDKRQFWAIRLRALSQDAGTLLTLSCARVPHEQQEMAIVRRWDVGARARGGKVRPHIAASILVGHCADCAPPYATTPDAAILAFVYMGRKLRVCETTSGTYSELASGTMGSSSKLALSPDGEWIAVAREDSEVNEGVIDLWSISTGQVLQKLYHPWQISALHFAGRQLVAALTDGTIQVWE
jgi:WD40 repeat protein